MKRCEEVGDLPDLSVIASDDWALARKRFEAIRPILEGGRPFSRLLRAQSASTGHSVSTLNRWMERYREVGDIRALLTRYPARRASGLDPRVVAIISDRYESYYLTSQQRSVAAMCMEVAFECVKNGLPRPHPNTVRNHVRRLNGNLGPRHVLKKRGRSSDADALYGSHQGSFGGHEGPWALVQIDHTPLDIMIVDEELRESIGRAFITIALDVFSRMVLGFYISLDPVGALSTGLCMLNAILPKDDWLRKHDIANAWPCWGMPVALHFDNAKEFLGKTVLRACELYDIRIDHRPVRTPHFGGHIERVIRTLNAQLHNLPGATFSNVTERGDYPSEALACVTLHELEGLVAEFITGQYHNRVHSGIGQSPLALYKKGILGAGGSDLGTGQRAFSGDIQRLRFDWMPYVERSIQRTGVRIDKLTYVGEVLGPYIGARGKDGSPESFIFLRDPRRINEIYFYAPRERQYYPLKLRDPLRPEMSLWEWNETRRRMAIEGKRDVDEDAIFRSYARTKDRVEAAEASTRQTRAARRLKARRLHHQRADLAPASAGESDIADWNAEELRPFEGAHLW